VETRVAVLEANHVFLKDTLDKLVTEITWIKNILVGAVLVGILLGCIQIITSK
jgi:hypothetical protein